MIILGDFQKLPGAKLFLKEKIEEVPVALINGDLPILAVLQAYFKGVVPTARMGTVPLVRATLRQVVGEQAPSGITHTHGAMNKGLQFDIRALSSDLHHLGKGHFAPEHAKCRALTLPKPHRQVGARIGLGRDV